MTRSPFRLPLAEFFAVVGVFFGAWLIHHTFTPAADTPNYVLVSLYCRLSRHGAVGQHIDGRRNHYLLGYRLQWRRRHYR